MMNISFNMPLYAQNKRVFWYVMEVNQSDIIDKQT